MAEKELIGRVAIVTGASRGIGKAIALSLAAEGAYIVACATKPAAEGTEPDVIKEIKAAGGDGEYAAFEVSDFAASEEVVKDVKKRLGHIDILVNNAGITRDNVLVMMKESEFDAVIDVNLKGTFNMMKHCSKFMMKQRGGVVINIASVTGIVGNVGQINYAASKAGIIGMTKTMARELAGRGVRCNAIAPGFVETDMTKNLSEDVKKAGENMIPLGRFAHPEEIAAAVEFLASDRASYITGQVIAVDGGMTMC